MSLVSPDKRSAALREDIVASGHFDKRSAALREDIVASGHLRFIHYSPDGRIVNVVYTLLEPPESAKEWNLSMSHATLAGPRRVEDDLAKMICEAFLDDLYQEVDPKAYWKNVRHFVKAV